MDSSYDHKIESIVDTARLQGGGSWDANLDPAKNTDGYMVAVFGMESIVEDEDFNADTVKAFFNEHESHIADQNFLGIWYDSSMGHYVFDVSMHVDDLRTAVLEGKHHQQTAIFDLAKDEEIYLNYFDDSGNLINIDQNLSLPSREGALWAKHFSNSEWKIAKGRKKSKLYYPNGDPSIDYGYRDKQQYETMLYVQRSGPSRKLYPSFKESNWHLSYDPKKAQISRENLIKQLSQQKWWNQPYDPRPTEAGDILRLHTDMNLYTGGSNMGISQIVIDKLGLGEHLTPDHINLSVQSGSLWEKVTSYRHKPVSDLYLNISGIPAGIPVGISEQRAAAMLRISDTTDIIKVKIPLEELGDEYISIGDRVINNHSDVIKRKTPYNGESAGMPNIEVLDTFLEVLPSDIAPLYKWIARELKDQRLDLDDHTDIDAISNAAPYIEWQRRFGIKDYTQGDFNPNVEGANLGTLTRWVGDLKQLGLDPETNKIPWDDDPIWTDKKGNTIYALDPEDDSDMIRHGSVLNHCYASEGSEYHQGYTSMMSEGKANMYAIRDKSGRPLASSLIGLRGVSPENPYGTEWVPLESRTGGSGGMHRLDPAWGDAKSNPVARILDGFLASAGESGIEIDRSQENVSDTPYQHPEFGTEKKEQDPADWDTEADMDSQVVYQGTAIDEIIDVADMLTRHPIEFRDGDIETDYEARRHYFVPGARIDIDQSDLMAATDDYIDDVINYDKRTYNSEIIEAVLALVLIAMYLGNDGTFDNVSENFSFISTMDAIIEAAFEGAKSLEKEQTATQQLIMPEEPENAQAVDLSTPMEMGDWVTLVARPDLVGQITNWFFSEFNSDEKKFEISFYDPNTNKFENTGGRWTAEELQKTQPPYLFNPWRYSDPEATETIDNHTLNSFIELLKFFKDNAPAEQFIPPARLEFYSNVETIVKKMAAQAEQQLSEAETNPSSTPLGQIPGQGDTDEEAVAQWFAHVKESVPQDSDVWFDPGLASRYRVPTTSDPKDDDDQMWKDWDEFVDDQDKVSSMKKKSDKFNTGDRVMFTDQDSTNADLGQGGKIIDKKSLGWKNPTTGDLVELYTVEWDNGSVGQAASFQLEQSWGKIPSHSPWDTGGEEEEGWSMVRNAKGE